PSSIRHTTVGSVPTFSCTRSSSGTMFEASFSTGSTRHTLESWAIRLAVRSAAASSGGIGAIPGRRGRGVAGTLQDPQALERHPTAAAIGSREEDERSEIATVREAEVLGRGVRGRLERSARDEAVFGPVQHADVHVAGDARQAQLDPGV